jgi:flagellar hook-associated protein 1 FlgK
MGGFGGLEIARKGLLAQQLSMEVAGQNIANVNTPGYARQVVVHGASNTAMAAAARTNEAAIALSAVDVARIHRQYDAYLDARYRDLSSQTQMATVQYEALSKLEEMIREPSEASIGAAMEDFWSSWGQLATTPNSTPNRLNVVFRGLAVAETFQQAIEQVHSLRTEAAQRAGEYTVRLNDLAANLAELNQVLVTSAPIAGQQPAGALLNKRDQILREIAEIAAVQVSDMGNGITRISIGGWTLVEGSRAFTLELQQKQVDGEIHLAWNDRPIDDTQVSGALGGSLAAYNTNLSQFENQLNTVATEFINQVNTVQAQGYKADGTPGQAFFVGTNAADIAVSPVLFTEPELLAASAGDDASDGDLAQRMADLRKQGIGPDAKCVSTVYRELIAELGAQNRTVGHSLENTQALANFTERQLQSISGVSLDEELADLVLYQQAYSAAARVLTIMDEALDVLINRTGLVGR